MKMATSRKELPMRLNLCGLIARRTIKGLAQALSANAIVCLKLRLIRLELLWVNATAASAHTAEVSGIDKTETIDWMTLVA